MTSFDAKRILRGTADVSALSRSLARVRFELPTRFEKCRALAQVSLPRIDTSGFETAQQRMRALGQRIEARLRTLRPDSWLPPASNAESVVDAVESRARAIANSVISRLESMDAAHDLLEECRDHLKHLVDQRPEEGRAEPDREQDPTDDGKRQHREAMAIGILAKHPGWSIAWIAKTVGVSRTTPYSWPTFMAVWKLFRQQRQRLPQGVKDSEGNIEAWPA